MIVKSIITNTFFSQHQQIVEGGFTYSPFSLDKDKCTENGTERADNSQDGFLFFCPKNEQNDCLSATAVHSLLSL